MRVCSLRSMLGTAAKKAVRLLDGHLQDLGNVHSLVLHLKGFAVVALAFTYFAGHINIG